MNNILIIKKKQLNRKDIAFKVWNKEKVLYIYNT